MTIPCPLPAFKLAMLYLTARHEDPRLHETLVKSQGGDTHLASLLLDAYLTELHVLASQLVLVTRDVDAAQDLIKLILAVSRNNLWKVGRLLCIAADALCWHGAQRENLAMHCEMKYSESISQCIVR